MSSPSKELLRPPAPGLTGPAVAFRSLRPARVPATNGARAHGWPSSSAPPGLLHEELTAASCSAQCRNSTTSGCGIRDGRSSRRRRRQPPAGGWPAAPSLGVRVPGSGCRPSPARNAIETAGDTKGTARKRRLERQKEERERKAEEDAVRAAEAGPPPWASIMERAAAEDPVIAEMLGDSIGNPEEMRRRVKEHERNRRAEMMNPKNGTATPPEVLFRDFDFMEDFIWFELYAKPSHAALDTLGSVLRAWYVLGYLGSFNSMNLQLSRQMADAPMSYSTEAAKEALPALFHSFGDLEFQDNLGRIWVDLGTADPLALDTLINALKGVSEDHVGIKTIVFGGEKYGDWEQDMTREEDGYLLYKI